MQAEERDTSCAAAAYMEMRERLRVPATEIRAVAFEKVDDGLGAVELRTQGGTSLLLTGVASGYGGEGAQLLAAILYDLRLFDRHDEALRWVAVQDRDSDWAFRT